MTTKKIAESVGKAEKTVRTWASKMAAKSATVAAKLAASSSAHPADYDLEETCSIIEIGMGKNAAGIFRANAKAHAEVSITQSTDLPSVVASMNNLAASIVTLAASMDGRLSKLEARIETRAALLPPPEINPRTHIVQLVNAYTKAHEIEQREVWHKLYDDFGYRYHKNVSVSAKNRGMSIIDYIDSEGMIESLESVALTILV